ALNAFKEPLEPLRIELLQETIAAHPDNTNRVVELALIYEASEKMDACIKLLLPYREKLGSTEGARLLGQHLLKEQKNEEAYKLLYPYVQARLQKLRAIEQNYTNTLTAVYHRAIQDLKQGRAGQSFYADYDKAAKADQETMV